MKRIFLFLTAAFLFVGSVTRGYVQEKIGKPQLMGVIIKAHEKHDQALGDFKKLRALLNAYLSQTSTPSEKPYPEFRFLLTEMDQDMLYLDRAMNNLQRWSDSIHDLFEGA